jgi:hypothetical protein
MTKFIMCCENCGSANVTNDGLLRWGVETQQWEASSELDCANCDDCDGDEVNIIRMTVEDYSAAQLEAAKPKTPSSTGLGSWG